MTKIVQQFVSYASVAAKKDSGKTKVTPVGNASRKPCDPKLKQDNKAAQRMIPDDLSVVVIDQAKLNEFIS